jgi:Lrp/AsnC family transcriptional regulator for asnA, asnC and gidA
MKANYTIDKLDKQIISILSKDATVPYADIAKRLVVSPGTIHVRMKKMKAAGVIKGSHLHLNESKFGYGICAFMGIHLQKGWEYEDAVAKLKLINEVVEAHYTTGKYGIFAKIICKDTDHLRSVLTDRISAIKGVERTETFISLEESVKKQLKIE